MDEMDESMTYNISPVIVLHLLDVVVDERLAFSALNDKLGRAVLEGAGREEDVFYKRQNTVVLDDLWGRKCLL